MCESVSRSRSPHIVADSKVRDAATDIFHRTSRIPVIYVFGRKPLDVAHCVEESVNLLVNAPLETQRRTVLLRHDVAYTSIAG